MGGAPGNFFWFLFGILEVYTWTWLSMPTPFLGIFATMLICGLIAVFLMWGRAVRPPVGLGIVAFVLFILGSV